MDKHRCFNFFFYLVSFFLFFSFFFLPFSSAIVATARASAQVDSAFNQSNHTAGYGFSLQPENTPEGMMTVLNNVIVPISSLKEITIRFNPIADIPDQLDTQPRNYQIGELEKFWATNDDTHDIFQVDSILATKTEHAYFWIEKNISFKQEEVESLAKTFEEEIYPRCRTFFGSEKSPGFDNDPHIFLFFFSNLGNHVGGYFASSDSNSTLVNKYSNSHETIYINMDGNASIKSAASTLAHELQHMIQWNQDANEESWLNEGFSMESEFLNGYDNGGLEYSYFNDTNMTLSDWPFSPSLRTPHYGAAFIFVDYFLGRFGVTAAKNLTSNPLNGWAGIEDVLADNNIYDNIRDHPITGLDVFQDWTIANLINDAGVSDGRYNYTNYPLHDTAKIAQVFPNCPIMQNNRSVQQFGVEYLKFECKPGNYTLSVQGVDQVKILNTEPHSGKFAFWSFKGDESNMRLQRTFDLTEAREKVSLRYWVWYDIEQDYDFAYLSASLDGKKWSLLNPPSCSEENKTGANIGCGYNGNSNGWRQMEVDLSQFAGKKVTLQFDYITDSGVHGEGFLIDDISIPEIGYATDFENDSGEWNAEGFVRIQNHLPQKYRITLVMQNSQTQVKYIELDEANTASIPVTFDNEKKSIILVASGVTQFTRQPATYSFDLQENH